MKKLLSAMMVAGAMAFASVTLVATPVAAQEAETLEAMEAEIEALLIANADDPDAFAAAVEAYVLAAGDAELAGDAVISVLTNPKSDAAREVLANNPGLKSAGGMGLGAAIAQIGLTNPTVAANMQAKVEASGDEGFQASVTQGSDASTGSTNEQAQQGSASDPNRDSTPETPVSPN
ncbi:MAG: hypothetical protein RIE84_07910 [Parvibaculum sp.]|uniref:hypothetical protein n=1 Tax=Parvibaculum sp. TaxID=2024848 RepID=UPI0032EBF087